MNDDSNAEEPRVGYFYITLLVVVLVAIVFAIVYYLNSITVF